MLTLSAALLGCQAAPDRQQASGQEQAPPPVVTPTATVAEVLRVIDGDTIQIGTPGGPRRTVRLIGIDTPERGQCGYKPASDYLRELIGIHGANEVTLTAAWGQDQDRYGRLLRYVSVHGIDLGLAQIQAGYAVARYDSRDGYRAHPRQATYIAADAAAAPFVCSVPTPTLRTESKR